MLQKLNFNVYVAFADALYVMTVSLPFAESDGTRTTETVGMMDRVTRRTPLSARCPRALRFLCGAVRATTTTNSTIPPGAPKRRPGPGAPKRRAHYKPRYRQGRQRGGRRGWMGRVAAQGPVCDQRRRTSHTRGSQRRGPLPRSARWTPCAPSHARGSQRAQGSICYRRRRTPGGGD
jgi:hypothetical protein